MHAYIYTTHSCMSQPIFILTLLKIWWGKKEKHSVCVQVIMIIVAIIVVVYNFLFTTSISIFISCTYTNNNNIHPFSPKTTINIRTSTLGFFWGSARDVYIVEEPSEKNKNDILQLTSVHKYLSLYICVYVFLSMFSSSNYMCVS